jgi:3-methyladenine DNA glycosylase/8-oxoguanine DNA glycosylase
MQPDWRGARLFTVGHSTRPLDELVALLRAFGVRLLADVRTVPRSRHNPQFDAGALPAALRARGIAYAHLTELGGLRHARRDSPNTGWRNASFRGYADYMQTPEFERGLEQLRALTDRGPVALMCAEAVPWRCHRSLIADALTARGAEVAHIASVHRANPHRLTPFARVDGARVTYPGDVALPVRAPFHLEATVRVLQRRPTNLVDVWEDDRYVRVLDTPDGLAAVTVANHGTIDAPDLRFKVHRDGVTAASQAAIALTLRRILGLDVEPEPLRRPVEAERRLRAVAPLLRGLRPPRFANLFETFASVIPFQQLSLESGLAIVGRLVTRFGEAVSLDGRRRLAFPRAAAVARARIPSLMACGLSRRKAEVLRGAARTIQAGGLDEAALAAMSSADAVRRLTALPGIGPWSANLILLRGLGRLDVFPPGDAGVARGLGSLLGLPPGAARQRVVERFGAVRGYLYFVSLGAALLRKGLIAGSERPGVIGQEGAENDSSSRRDEGPGHSGDEHLGGRVRSAGRRPSGRRDRRVRDAGRLGAAEPDSHDRLRRLR